MKFNKFLFGAAALSMGVFASCSSDEPVKGPDGGNENAEGDRYMAVSITNASSSRAAGEGFEEGVGDENKIEAENVRFYFFNANKQPFTLVNANVDGTVSKSNMVKPIDLTAGNQTQDGDQTISTGVLVLGKADPESPYVGTVPSYVMCAANLTEVEFNDLAGKSMEEAAKVTRTKLQDAASNPGEILTWSTFAMVNSTYAENSEKVIASAIPEGSICETPDAAKKSPVNIYVERLAAKVRVTGLDVYQPQESATNTAKVTYDFNKPDGAIVKTNLYVNLTGWRLKNRYVYSKLIKDIDPAANYFVGWNVPAYHRCYWGVTPSDDTYLFQQGYDINDTENAVTGFVLKNYDSNKPTENVRYTYANTAWATDPESASDRTKNVTSIVVRGEVCSDESGQIPVNFVRWAGGYYLLEDFKTVVANQYRVQFNISADSNLEVSLQQIKGKNKYYAKVNDQVYDRFTDISWWNEGRTSYNVNIKHAVDPEGNTLYAVVRNHIYDTNFTAVVGLGLPGNEIENPENEKESYIAATINVLNWKLVKNDVVLESK